MNLTDQLDALLDATAFDSTGTKIGAVRQLYVDDASGKMTFATVSTGIFSADAIVPLHGARLLDDELHLDHTRSVIRDSPRPDHTEDGLTPDQEIRLLEYYGIEAPAREPETSTAAQTPTAEAAPGSPAPVSSAKPDPAASSSGSGTGDTGDESDGKAGDEPDEKPGQKAAGGDDEAGADTKDAPGRD